MSAERLCGCGAIMSANYAGETCVRCERGLPRPRFGRISPNTKNRMLPAPPPAAYLTIAAIVIGPILGMALVAWLIWQAWP